MVKRHKIRNPIHYAVITSGIRATRTKNKKDRVEQQLRMQKQQEGWK